MTTRPHSVLIVEDERIVARDIQQTLAALGFDAFAIASSAEEAIARASERCPDVVLMDIRIKGRRDGIETAELLRTRFDVPIVYLTAHADEATIERAKTTQPYGYLLKPVRTAELHSAVELSVYRHRMEQHVRERERWYATTLRSIADAVVSVDLAGKVTFMNAAAESLTGVKAEDVIGRPARDAFRFARSQGQALAETPLDEALRVRTAVEVHDMVLVDQATGKRRLIEDSAAPVVEDGRALGAVMVFRDVTAHKQLQLQLELSNRLASLGTLAGGVAHEINNPLAVVTMATGFLAAELAQLRSALAADSSHDEIDRRLAALGETLTDVQGSADRIAGIVSDLRTFARPTPSTERGTTDVVRCAEWAIRTTARERSNRARLATRFTAAPSVVGDDARIGQVLINLLINAAHAIAPGHPEHHEIVVAIGDAPHGQVVIEVIDSGAGIPPEALPRVFEPFFTTKPAGHGAGLGLSICHGIVASLGGRIEVESEVGKGTTVRVLLPAANPPPPAVSAIPAPPPARRARILVIDDDPLVLRVLGRVLRAHDVTPASSAAAALEIIDRGERFDVIFSDLSMPGQSGIELHDELLRRDPDVARRVVFMSGGNETAAEEAFFDSVPNLLIGKPIPMADLLALVAKLTA